VSLHIIRSTMRVKFQTLNNVIEATCFLCFPCQLFFGFIREVSITSYVMHKWKLFKMVSSTGKQANFGHTIQVYLTFLE
jgi:hypothetical protein